MTDIKEGDRVEVIAKVDHEGEEGVVVSTTEKGKHPIMVEFYGHWACYSPDEIKKL